MCLRKSKASTRIERICVQNRFSQGIVQEKAKKIFDQYRDGKTVAQYVINNDEETIDRAKKKIRDKYDQTYNKKEGHKTGSLDYLIMEIVGTSWADKLVERTYAKIDELGIDQGDYRKILDMYYFGPSVRDDDYIMDIMNLARATYYRRKKEAITLFGIMLWNTLIEECIV